MSKKMVPGIRRLAWALLLGACAAIWSGPSLADEMEDARRIVNAAKAEADEIPAQAIALTRLAWPDGPITQHAVSSLAREQIVGFGDHGLEAMKDRVRTAPDRYKADITSAIIETRLVVTSGLPAQYLPSLYDAVWYGSIDAKRLGIFELSRYRFPMATLPMIDAAYEYPRLRKSTMHALQRQGDDRARHFLEQVLLEADPDYLDLAAETLAAIGGRAMETLRNATLNPNAALRGAAVDALIPVSGVDDLTILYEYVATYPDDPPERMDLVLQRAAQLEAMMEARRDLEDESDF